MEKLRTLPILSTIRVTLGLLPILLATRVFAQEMPPQPPDAADDYILTDSHTASTVCVVLNDTGYDAPIDPSTVTIVSPPTTGSASVDTSTGSIQFTPDPGASVADLLTYVVSDENGLVSNEATVWIIVEHMPPEADDDIWMMDYLETATIDILTNDLGGTAGIDPATVAIVTHPSHGSLAVSNVTGDVSYTPDELFTGNDWFEYTVSDTDGVVSNVARVDVYVMNESPTIISLFASRDSYGTWLIQGAVQDENPDMVTIQLGGLGSGTVSADPDGYFEAAVLVPAGTCGIVTAVATDEIGAQSDEQEVMIDDSY